MLLAAATYALYSVLLKRWDLGQMLDYCGLMSSTSSSRSTAGS